jgi:YHS domain-containing protein
MNRYLYVILGLVVVLIVAVGGCKNPQYIYEDGKVLVGGDGKPIILIDNPDAIDPTYAELLAFIQQDTTDANNYLEDSLIGYVCADFAEDVHNNAEAAGIRAASVSVDFEGDEKGHACNAFNTIDKGLVYIDCTGQGFEEKLNFHPEYTGKEYVFVSDNPDSWDAVAYIKVGKEYGLVPLAKARALYYSFYEEYEEKWQVYQELLAAFNDEVTQFNQEIQGKTYYKGSEELARMEDWQAELEKQGELLDRLSEELGNVRFEPKGIVRDVWIHWGPGE